MIMLTLILRMITRYAVLILLSEEEALRLHAGVHHFVSATRAQRQFIHVCSEVRGMRRVVHLVYLKYYKVLNILRYI